MSTSQKLCLDDIRHLYTKGTLYKSYGVLPKTRVELLLVNASALIRSTPNWAEQLHDESKRQEWTAQVENDLKLTDKEVEYVFAELEYYAQLKASGCNGEELGGVDKVWIYDTPSDCELASEFKDGVLRLASDHAALNSSSEDSNFHDATQVLIDPFMYPFAFSSSLILDKPITSPKAALGYVIARDNSEPVGRTIKDIARHSMDIYVPLEKLGLSHLVNAYEIFSSNHSYMGWLPTDFDISEDGSVSIRSYINNLHPTRYEGLYKAISKVFSKFVPLLEQVATDVIHPRGLRAVFNREKCLEPGMLHPDEVIGLLGLGKPVPEGYQRFVTTSYDYCHTSQNGRIANVNGTSLDTTALKSAWAKALKYTEPEPLPFSPSGRPIVPYSMRGLSLQASVEMASIDLTPDNPSCASGKWQAVGRCFERIFAVCLYFYDVENIASAELMFRDPVEGKLFKSVEEKEEFYRSHIVENGFMYGCRYSQEVGGIEIKAGRLICYPNFYQTMMPAFELADPTKPGHVRYISFYVTDPYTKMFSTEIVPPQDPSWTQADRPDDSKLAEQMGNLNLNDDVIQALHRAECRKRDRFKDIHKFECQEDLYKFEARLRVGGYYDQCGSKDLSDCDSEYSS
ncbi:hypothetical protein GGI13_000810 [Coemansia sp. RSA 455]|nr:hypothetical protein GGH13_001900 [Coemansia sp. S155-1]KAJ2113015.1 hypothetical protein IW146_004185 [Coemansia sp. RSA 922]KAJ2257739.1 hypothetical protein GGI13_000810 [Coemansia sp. RSA 455]